MTLAEKQQLFVRLIAQLILHAQALGLELTLGEAYRSPEEAARLSRLGKGIAQSLHTQRLAIDFNLFQHGVYQTDTEAYRPLGEFWERQHVWARWGGRFTGKTAGDAGHFSLAHEGTP